MATATQQGVVQPDVCNPLDTGRPPPLKRRTPTPESFKGTEGQVRSGTIKHRSAPKQKAEYALHLLPTYTHAVISGSWMQ